MKSFFPQEYKWQQMILISLGVLSIGFAIAFIGYWYMNLKTLTYTSSPAVTPLPTQGNVPSQPIPTDKNRKICNTNADCNPSETCIGGGPMPYNKTVIKRCFPKGTILPM